MKVYTFHWPDQVDSLDVDVSLLQSPSVLECEDNATQTLKNSLSIQGAQRVFRTHQRALDQRQCEGLNKIQNEGGRVLWTFEIVHGQIVKESIRVHTRQDSFQDPWFEHKKVQNIVPPKDAQKGRINK